MWKLQRWRATSVAFFSSFFPECFENISGIKEEPLHKETGLTMWLKSTDGLNAEKNYFLALFVVASLDRSKKFLLGLTCRGHPVTSC